MIRVSEHYDAYKIYSVHIYYLISNLMKLVLWFCILLESL